LILDNKNKVHSDLLNSNVIPRFLEKICQQEKTIAELKNELSVLKKQHEILKQSSTQQSMTTNNQHNNSISYNYQTFSVNNENLCNIQDSNSKNIVNDGPIFINSMSSEGNKEVDFDTIEKEKGEKQNFIEKLNTQVIINKLEGISDDVRQPIQNKNQTKPKIPIKAVDEKVSPPKKDFYQQALINARNSISFSTPINVIPTQSIPNSQVSQKRNSIKQEPLQEKQKSKQASIHRNTSPNIINSPCNFKEEPAKTSRGSKIILNQKEKKNSIILNGYINKSVNIKSQISGRSKSLLNSSNDEVNMNYDRIYKQKEYSKKLLDSCKN
jgi:hypothetical protein